MCALCGSSWDTAWNLSWLTLFLFVPASDGDSKRCSLLAGLSGPTLWFYLSGEGSLVMSSVFPLPTHDYYVDSGVWSIRGSSMRGNAGCQGSSCSGWSDFIVGCGAAVGKQAVFLPVFGLIFDGYPGCGVLSWRVPDSIFSLWRQILSVSGEC